MHRGVKQGSALSPALFNNSIRKVTRRIPQYLIEPYIDASRLSYAKDILLLADNLGLLKNAVDVVCSVLKEIGLSVATSKTEFLVFGTEIASNDTIQVGPATISSSSSFRYLGLPFEASIRSTRQLIIASLKEKLRKSYGLLARVKGQFDKRTLGRLYNAFLHRMCACF